MKMYTVIVVGTKNDSTTDVPIPCICEKHGFPFLRKTEKEAEDFLQWLIKNYSNGEYKIATVEF